MFEERKILAPEIKTVDEVSHEEGLRPRSFNEFVGQKNIIKNVQIMVESSRLRKTSVDHILLSGPPGLGKTSLAYLVAKEIGCNLNVISGPAIEKKGDLD